ncbi:MAG: DUF3817 domain-containing protein [Gordonia sp. (in: high G+C Gram-positive bacteria)]|uniref:DUF3817 domain-containing protein n=1 Tax=Gordonia sp. (in: high G+C Gram-positive bacteria) TaxID=84139 RepID=UPI0039E6AAE8
MTKQTGRQKWFDVASPASRFRLIALIEAITWGLLIIGMILKRAGGIESATMVPGMLHGIAFMAYVAITLWAAVELKWNWKISALALVASLPPFCTLIFEWWAERNGHLDQPTDSDTGDERERLTV